MKLYSGTSATQDLNRENPCRVYGTNKRDEQLPPHRKAAIDTDFIPRGAGDITKHCTQRVSKDICITYVLLEPLYYLHGRRVVHPRTGMLKIIMASSVYLAGPTMQWCNSCVSTPMRFFSRNGVSHNSKIGCLLICACVL